MGTALNVQAWSTTAASNDGADSTIGTVANTSSPTSVDDWTRGIMASIARYADDTGGALVAGGSATALTVTTGQALSSGHIANGLRLCVRTASAATGAATIAVDGLTAVDIKANDGSAIRARDWSSGSILDLVYSSTASAFIAANIAQWPSSRACFAAHKNDSSQSISTTSATQVTFGTESYDIGSAFASNAWTPPAGKVRMRAMVRLVSLTDASYGFLYIYKNASPFRAIADHYFDSTTNYAVGSTPVALIRGLTLVLDIDDDANGTDAYTVYVRSDDSSYSVDGGIGLTRFEGSMI